MTNLDHKKINEIRAIAEEASRAIMRIYQSDFKIEIKDDRSPLTKADLTSHKIITKSLIKLTPEIPIISEESSDIPISQRSSWMRYWLIDPLDGTKEFVNRNGEFTVNIALIEDGTPVFGLIVIPSSGQHYWGSYGLGSFYGRNIDHAEKIEASKKIEHPVKIVVSRSHDTDELDKINQIIKRTKLEKVGSSLKFCMIAKGEANLYFRSGPTCEWDTAAGHAIVKFSGGSVMKLDGSKLIYNQNQDYINPGFIVCCDEAYAKEILLMMDNHKI